MVKFLEKSWLKILNLILGAVIYGKNHLKNLVFSLYEQGYQPVINRK